LGAGGRSPVDIRDVLDLDELGYRGLVFLPDALKPLGLAAGIQQIDGHPIGLAGHDRLTDEEIGWFVIELDNLISI
jgi:hypothetical protein